MAIDKSERGLSFMKRILSLALAVLMLLGIAACGGEKEPEGFQIPKVEAFSVGFGKTEITPEYGTPMGGFGNSATKLSNSVLDPLYTVVMAMSDGTDTYLLVALDVPGAYTDFVDPTVELISTETGLPKENILMCSVHNHSAPDMGSIYKENEQAAKVHEQFRQGTLEAAKTALLDLSPATMLGGKTKTEQLAFVRHFLLNDNTYAGDNFGNWSSGIKDYALPVDDEVVAVKFQREGKKDLVLVNFNIHPCFTAGNEKYEISADCVGATRDYLASKGMDCIYFTGAAGNQNGETKILEDVTNFTHVQWGEKLGEYVLNLEYTDITGQDIKMTSEVYTGQVWKETDLDRVAKAKEVYQLFQQTDRDTATPLAKQYGLASVYEAREIINHAESLPDTWDIPMTTLSVGGWGIVVAPYEMFGTQGTYIKDNSAFPVTTILGYAAPHVGYIPDVRAYEYGCYESQTAKFVSGTAEILADKYLDLLQSIK